MIDDNYQQSVPDDEKPVRISPYEIGLLIILFIIIISVLCYFLILAPAIANIFSNIHTGMNR